MAAAVNKNNAYSTLAGTLTNVATSMTVATGHGDRFPIVTAPDWAMVTLADAAGNVEIVKVTARASGADTMTITRAQEGTTAQAWDIGDIVELRPTAGTMATVDGTQTLTNKSISGSSNTFTNIPTSALVVVSAIKAVLDAATLLAARAALGLTSVGEALATAASAAAARSAIGAADASTVALKGANTDITSLAAPEIGAATATTAAAADRSTKVATTAQAGYNAPAGAVMAFAMNAAPSGWLKCNGAAVSRTTYANLFAAIGTTFGVGDNSTTFNLPDLRGEFIRGWADDRAVDTGRVFGSAQGDLLEDHQHPNGLVLGGSGAGGNGGSWVSTATTTGTVSTAGVAGAETRPRNIALLYCIRT